MLTIIASKRFEKALKQYAKNGQKDLMHDMQEVIDLLSLHNHQSLLMLQKRWQDHELKGSKQGIRELHLQQNILLLYAIDVTESSLQLLDIVNHDALRKR